MAKLVSHKDNKAVITHVVEYSVFKEKINEAYKKNKGRFNIHGFRKGKAPKAIIENNYGKDIFWNDALDILLPEVYSKIVKELDLKPVSTPKVDIENDIEEGVDLELKFEVETFPVIELADYSNIEVEKQDEEVSEELVDAKIQEEIEKNKVIKPVDREIIEGDIVNIDFEGFKDGVAFEGGKSENYDLTIGAGQFIPGFEEGLIDKKKGEEVELNIKFPEDYNVEDLKGKDVVFKVKINDIKEEIYPELDDDFVMDVSEFDTVEEYKESIRKELHDAIVKNNDTELENAVIDEVIKRTEFSVPNQMVEDQLDDEYKEYLQQIQSMGMQVEQYFNLSGQTEEKIREQLRDRAENKVRIEVILDALLEAKEYNVTEEEIEEEYNNVAKEYNREGDEKFIELVKAQVNKNTLSTILKRRKVIEELKENVVFVEKSEKKEEENE